MAANSTLWLLLQDVFNLGVLLHEEFLIFLPTFGVEMVAVAVIVFELRYLHSRVAPA